MAWANGTRLFRSIIEILYENVEEDEVRRSVYTSLIEEFEELDVNLKELYNETDDPAFDEAFCALYPENCKMEEDGDEEGEEW